MPMHEFLVNIFYSDSVFKVKVSQNDLLVRIEIGISKIYNWKARYSRGK